MVLPVNTGTSVSSLSAATPAREKGTTNYDALFQEWEQMFKDQMAYVAKAGTHKTAYNRSRRFASDWNGVRDNYPVSSLPWTIADTYRIGMLYSANHEHKKALHKAQTLRRDIAGGASAAVAITGLIFIPGLAGGIGAGLKWLLGPLIPGAAKEAVEGEKTKDADWAQDPFGDIFGTPEEQKRDDPWAGILSDSAAKDKGDSGWSAQDIFGGLGGLLGCFFKGSSIAGSQDTAGALGLFSARGQDLSSQTPAYTSSFLPVIVLLGAAGIVTILILRR